MLVFKARRRATPALREELTPSEKRVIRRTVEARLQVEEWIARNMTQFADAVAHRPWTTVADMIPIDPWYDYQEYLEGELLAEVLAAGDRTVNTPVVKAQTPVLGYAFDRTRPEAAGWAARHSGDMVREITQGQRLTIRDLIAMGQSNGLSPMDTAREIRQTVGLTTQQAGWVNSFYDRTFASNISAGMSPAQAAARAQAATGRYHDRIHRYRAETIARTEIMSANSMGRQMAWMQGIEQGFISPLAEKEWIAEVDACEICAPRNGTRNPVSKPWPEGEPPAHPNCRCDLLLIPEPIGATPVPAPITTGTGMPYDLSPRVLRDDFAANIGRRSRAVRQQVQDDITDSFGTVAQQEVKIRISDDAARQVLEEGRVKNAYEVLDAADNPNYMSTRSNIESTFIGVPEEAVASQRPIYGVINNYQAADRYGGVSIVLRNDVKGRTTMAVGDSFNGVNPVSLRDILEGTATVDDMGRAISDFTWAEIRSGKVSLRDATKSQYWEAQIHGGVTLKDIARLEVPEGWLESLSPAARAALERSGIDVVVI